jgi:hypothetical protein
MMMTRKNDDEQPKTQKAKERYADKVGTTGTFQCIKCGTNKPMDQCVEVVQQSLHPRGYCKTCKQVKSDLQIAGDKND